MMKFTVNIRKRHLIAFLFSFVLFLGVYFVMAQTATSNPRHDSNEVWVRDITKPGHPTFVAQTLESWLGWLGGKVLDNSQDITNLQNSVPQVVEGREVYLGRVTIPVSSSTSTIQASSFSGISRVRFNIVSGGAFGCPVGTNVICGSGNPISNGAWACACDSTGQRATGTSCIGGNPPSISFGVVPHSGEVSGHIIQSGFSRILVSSCGSAPFGNKVIDVYATPQVIKVGNTRFGDIRPIQGY